MLELIRVALGSEVLQGECVISNHYYPRFLNKLRLLSHVITEAILWDWERFTSSSLQLFALSFRYPSNLSIPFYG